MNLVDIVNTFLSEAVEKSGKKPAKKKVDKKREKALAARRALRKLKKAKPTKARNAILLRLINMRAARK